MSLYDFDQLTIIGRAGADAEMRYLDNGNPVTSFSVAVDRSYNDKNGELVKRTIWYRVSVFGKFAETCQNIKKGERVFVVGVLTPDGGTGGPRIWKKNDGTPAASFEVNASVVRFLSQRKTENKQSAPVDESPF